MIHQTVSRLRRRSRRLFSATVFLLALVFVGGLYAAAAPAGRASAADNGTVRAGKTLYEEGCITCHGRDLQGVQDRGPSLLGVGAAAVDFQVSTGRMPLPRQQNQAPSHRKPVYNAKETRQLAAYVQSVGGGPQIPTGDLRGSNISTGGELFRLNCASCHNFAGAGASLTKGKQAPSLDKATNTQLYEAMLTGPGNMPQFGESTLTPAQKKNIISYIQTLKKQPDPGGWGLGRIGPVSEGLLAWVAGIGLIVLAAVWIGVKA